SSWEKTRSARLAAAWMNRERSLPVSTRSPAGVFHMGFSCFPSWTWLAGRYARSSTGRPAGQQKQHKALSIAAGEQSQPLAVEALPVEMQLATQLGDPCGAELVLVGQLSGPEIPGHVQGDLAQTRTQLHQPGRVIDPEGGLVGHGTAGVVA